VRIAVIGGTGKIGRRLLPALCRHDVQAITRSHEAAQQIRRSGNVRIVHADLDQPETLEPALRDMDVVFLATPFHPQQTDREIAAVDAAEAAGVARFVKVSSYAAGVRPLVPSAAAHVEVEGRLRRSSMTWSALRPDWWLDNVLTQLDHLRNGELYFPAGGAMLSPVDLRDVADVAAAEIVADVPFGGVLLLTGAQALTFPEVVERLSRAAGVPFKPRDDVAPEWSDHYAHGMRLLWESYRERGFAPRTHTIAELLQRQPRTIEDFGSQVLGPALRAI
jgi:uncharacterized protein YbjT (DUF2867 family)